ncbi:MAG: aminopeptidase P family protein [Hyphomicrobiaceae bacterium]|nr:MAG: aminopeptidase P family protein [Hyphomicrobiaceae bacterium]
MLDLAKPAAARPAIPFDTGRLDRLMEEAGIDLLLSTSKHNVQYLLGGHRSIFFDYMDATGVTRYLPVLVYPKGAPDQAAYIGHRLESHQKEVEPFWTPEALTSSSGSTDATQKAIAYVRKAGLKAKRIGVELPFLPADAAATLRDGLPDSQIKACVFVLERLRAKKRPDELALLRRASELVIEAMLAVISKHGPGTSKRQLFEALRREEVNRGMTFEYCLLTAGTRLNRAPSEQRWETGDIISLDSGGNYHGYIGDLCRMAIQGEPDAELEDLLGEIEQIQRAAMAPIKAGALGAVIYDTATPLLRQSKNHNHLHFLAHGMGLVSHEAPRLAPRGSMPYDPYDADYPLEPGMVISVATPLHHPRRGFIKLEDTVVVTDTGFEIYGEGARGWNRGGTAAAA